MLVLFVCSYTYFVWINLGSGDCGLVEMFLSIGQARCSWIWNRRFNHSCPGEQSKYDRLCLWNRFCLAWPLDAPSCWKKNQWSCVSSSFRYRPDRCLGCSCIWCGIADDKQQNAEVSAGTFDSLEINPKAWATSWFGFYRWSVAKCLFFSHSFVCQERSTGRLGRLPRSTSVSFVWKYDQACQIFGPVRCLWIAAW